MQRTLTSGPITSSILLFALPLMFGNLLQQMYNIADTWVVGRFLGADALAAVGSSYTLMTFLTSILLGLCMGSGAAISMQYGSGESEKMRRSVFQSFVLIAGIALVLNLLVYLGLDGILWVLRVPEELKPLMKDYLLIIFLGITATFLYNYFANLLRAIGNSVVPLVFLAVSAILNVFLDLFCVIVIGWGIKGAAGATVFSQFVSGVGIGVYTLKKFPELCPRREDCRWDKQNLAAILNLSVMTSVQQSIMNFGILMVQGLVNSFGTVIMAAFAAAVKIDSFAYMPVQDFGNAFSTYVAQNYGANQPDRIKKGIRSAGLTSAVFCIVISVLVCALDVVFNFFLINPTRQLVLFGQSVTVWGAGLAVPGAALGTALSTVVGGLLALGVLLLRDGPLCIRKPGSWRITSACLRNLWRVGTPLAAERAALSSAQVLLVRIVSGLGTVAIAANSLGVSAEGLCYMAGYGIQDASIALIGQAVGAHRRDMAKRFAWLCTMMGIGIMALSGVGLWLFAPALMGIFTADAAVIALGAQVLRIEAFAEPMFGASIVASGAMQGAGDSTGCFLLNLFSMWGVRLTLAFLLAPRLGLMGVWGAMCCELSIRGLLFLIRLARGKWLEKGALS